MKKILLILIAVSTVLAFCACSAKKSNIHSNIKPNNDKNTIEQDEALDSVFDLSVSADSGASPFDKMSTAQFRKEIRPYLDAWYEFCYRKMWWLSVGISEGRETYERYDGSLFIKASSTFATPDELSAHINKWGAKDMYLNTLSEQTLNRDDGLYLLQISSGWYGEPDYNSAQYVTSEGGKYYVRFDELSGTAQHKTITHVVCFEIVDGRLLITDNLTLADGLELVVKNILKSEITPALMSNTEFKEFVILMLNRYCQLIGKVEFSEDSISRCTDSLVLSRCDCAAEVIVNGKYCYLLMGKDETGRYDILSIEIM